MSSVYLLMPAVKLYDALSGVALQKRYAKIRRS